MDILINRVTPEELILRDFDKDTVHLIKVVDTSESTIKKNKFLTDNLLLEIKETIGIDEYHGLKIKNVKKHLENKRILRKFPRWYSSYIFDSALVAKIQLKSVVGLSNSYLISNNAVGEVQVETWQRHNKELKFINEILATYFGYHLYIDVENNVKRNKDAETYKIYLAVNKYIGVSEENKNDIIEIDNKNKELKILNSQEYTDRVKMLAIKMLNNTTHMAMNRVTYAIKIDLIQSGLYG